MGSITPMLEDTCRDEESFSVTPPDVRSAHSLVFFSTRNDLAPAPDKRTSASAMPPVKFPQREMLRRLLDSGKLTSSEAGAVREMHDALTTGRIGGLNQRQAAWAEEVCRRCGIVVARARPDSRKKGKDAAKKLVAEFDALPRPKKPPGRG
jgi:hypothetical protein